MGSAGSIFFSDAVMSLAIFQLGLV